MARSGNLYEYTRNKNAIFPNSVYVTDSSGSHHVVVAAGVTNDFPTTGTTPFNKGPIHLGQGDNNAFDLGADGRINSSNNTLFGLRSGALTLGHNSYPINIRGKADRPTYNGAKLALQSDIPTALLKSGKQTTTSNDDGGANVYTFTDTKGNTSTFTVKNGHKGSNGVDGKTWKPSVDSSGKIT